MEEKDREVQVGENRFYLGEDNIVYFTLVGEHDEKRAIACKDAFLKLVNMVEGKANVLGDLNAAGKQSPEARTIWKELNEHEKIGKIALIGFHPVARVIASFVMGISKKKDMRLFKTKEKALAWLKE
ncbi:hypothetical protein E3J48_05395 [Candidatus Aerophobetes bacterium]|uniref:DUF7793 domain-containing protein n=1 Tax=Aerophobetes bacterium TaxID=2030807 RepID=A0A523W4D2_UNCAE|nr:MAG: hypothetical protein E3J48_05395 [Candidatus Aerophobetes bacterium]